MWKPGFLKSSHNCITIWMTTSYMNSITVNAVTCGSSVELAYITVEHKQVLVYNI